jgi:hypothetical protein
MDDCQNKEDCAMFSDRRSITAFALSLTVTALAYTAFYLALTHHF